MTRGWVAAAAAVCVASLVGRVALAQTSATWSTTPGSGELSTASNWIGGSVPSGGTATFGSSSVTALTLSTSNMSVDGFTFNAGAPAYSFTINSGGLTLTGAGITNNSSNTPAFTVNSPLTFQGSSAGGATFVINSGGTTTFTSGLTAGASTGNASFTVNSGGQLVLNVGTTAGTGVTIVNNSGGAVTLGGGGTLTVGSISGGGNIQLGSALTTGGNNSDATISGVISGGGFVSSSGSTLTKTGTGTLTLSGANTYLGGTTVSAGTLQGTTTSLQGAIANNASVVFSQSTSGTYSSNMSGTGSVTVTGGGTVTFTGTNSYSGGTTVSAGVLQGTPASLQGNIVDNASVVFNQLLPNPQTTVATSANISGTGSVTVTGFGTVILNGTNTYTGGTTLSSGILEIGDGTTSNASIAGNLTVPHFTVLAGHGTVGGTVTNSGVVFPGGALTTPNRTMGTLTISGSYVQTSSGTLDPEIAPTTASKLAVGGSATLAGTLFLTYHPGSTYTPGTTYKILTAGSGVSGTFGTVSQTAGFTQTVTYLPNEVDVTVGTISSLINSGGGSSGSSGSATTGATPSSSQSTFAAAGVATSTLFAHLDQVAQGTDSTYTATASTSPLQVAFAGGEEQLGAILPQLSDALGKNGGWLRATGTLATINSEGGTAGYNSSGGAFLAGFDRWLAPDLLAGIAAGYGRSTAHIHDTGGSSEAIETPRALIYGRYLLPTAYIDAAVGYAYDSFDMTRPDIGAGATATSRHDGQEVSFAMEAGRPYDAGWAEITPKFGFQYLHLSEDGYTENGAGANDLTVASHDADSLRPQVGASIERSFATDDGTRIVPEAHASYSYEVLNVSHQVTEQDATGIGPTTVIGLSPGRSVVGLGTGVAVTATQRMDVFAAYDADLSPGNSTVQTVSAGLRVKF